MSEHSWHTHIRGDKVHEGEEEVIVGEEGAGRDATDTGGQNEKWRERGGQTKVQRTRWREVERTRWREREEKEQEEGQRRGGAEEGGGRT